MTPQKLQQKKKKKRTVYDSAKSQKYVLSLNDCLYRGLVILPDLCRLLTCSRLYTTSITADFEKIFLQISLVQPDRDITQFLWLKDTNQEVTKNNLEIFGFCKVFHSGLITVPSDLQPQFNIICSMRQHSLTAFKIKRNIYVVNVCHAQLLPMKLFPNTRNSRKNSQKLSMNLREFVSNDADWTARMRKRKSNATMRQDLSTEWMAIKVRKATSSITTGENLSSSCQTRGTSINRHGIQSVWIISGSTATCKNFPLRSMERMTYGTSSLQYQNVTMVRTH